MNSTFFTDEQLKKLNKSRVPRHIAIIPDGNRRFAKQQNHPLAQGHKAGADILIDVIKAAKSLGVKAVTFYLFSTENWNRSEEEINLLMWILKEFLSEQCEEMVKEDICLHTIGEISRLPTEVLMALEKTKKQTVNCKTIDMILALNYGGRNEITRVVQKIIELSQKKNLQKQDITEAMIADNLDTAPFGDPDLLIRTSGEMRISNFLLWQLSYTELYVTDVLWPNFTPNHLLEAVIDYQKRERRLGGE